MEPSLASIEYMQIVKHQIFLYFVGQWSLSKELFMLVETLRKIQLQQVPAFKNY